MVSTHPRTHLTTRAPAALFGTSQSAADPIIHHLRPVPARPPTPNPDQHRRPWIIDATLIPAHDRAITAPANNYRRSINTQIRIHARTRSVITVGKCWPANRNDVVLARTPVAHLLTGDHDILGDGGYRGIPTITTPRPDNTIRIIGDQHWRTHRRIRAHVEHLIARLKDWQILRQSRRRGNAINHNLHIIAGLWNLKTPNSYGSTLSSDSHQRELSAIPPGGVGATGSQKTATARLLTLTHRGHSFWLSAVDRLLGACR